MSGYIPSPREWVHDQVAWQIELVAKPGELDNFRALTGEMVEALQDIHEQASKTPIQQLQ